MAGVSIFQDVPLVPIDHVFNVNNNYNEDKDPRKVNLGIGGKIFVEINRERWPVQAFRVVQLLAYNLCSNHGVDAFFPVVSAYRDNDGNPMVLPVVANVEKRLAEEILQKTLNHEYLQIDGLGAFRDAACKLLLGEDSPAIVQNRVC